MEGFRNLSSFLHELRKQQELIEIEAPVDPKLEIAEIHRCVAAANGPALLFKSVKGSPFPVVTNLFGTKRRVDIAFRNRPEKILSRLVRTLTGPFPPPIRELWPHRRLLSILRPKVSRWKQGVMECRCDDLTQLPFLTSWPLDGGPFLTLPLVYTHPPEGPDNLGMYRIQRFDSKTLGLHFQIQKGGGFHYHQAESRNQPLPVSIFLGGPPACILSAICPLPENVPELLMAAFLQGGRIASRKIPDHPNPILTECEFALIGWAPPHIRRPEGPFGDHYGYYSLQHDFPIFQLQKGFHRKGAIYPATVVGKPRQEDFFIGEYLQSLLSPLFPIVMPGVLDLWSYGETGFHALSAAVVQERYYRECMRSAFRILGEGQLSLTKFLLLTDQHVDLKNFPLVLSTILERFQPETDLFIFSNLSLDTLDYTGPTLNRGSRGVLLGIGEPKRRLRSEWIDPLPRGIEAAVAYCPGCLVIEGSPLEPMQLQEWPLVIQVDNVHNTISSTAAFLWSVFTRFDPASDITSASQCLRANHIVYEGSIFLDARMKPSYPATVEPDEETEAKVANRWLEYFPQGMNKGSSRAAHVY